MFTRRDSLWLAALPLALPIALLARKEWREGRLEAVEIKDFETGKHHVDHRYVCTISDVDLLYYVEYEKPLKAPVHDSVRFVIDKDDIIVLDSDNKERKGRIEKRERAAK